MSLEISGNVISKFKLPHHHHLHLLLKACRTAADFMCNLLLDHKNSGHFFTDKNKFGGEFIVHTGPTN
jgi:hypothetical protein